MQVMYAREVGTFMQTVKNVLLSISRVNRYGTYNKLDVMMGRKVMDVINAARLTIVSWLPSFADTSAMFSLLACQI